MGQDFKVYDSWSSESAEAERLHKRLAEALSPLAHGISLGFENSIPTVEAWLNGDAVMSLQRALAIGRAVAEVSQAPVHFFDLRGSSVTFFVFSDSLNRVTGTSFRQAQLDEYGTPFSQWSDGVQATF